MGWSLADVETVTAHGRPAEQLIPFFAPEARIIALTKDETTPATIAQLLVANGYDESRMNRARRTGRGE